MLAETSLQQSYNTFIAAYADDLNAAGPIDQLRNGGMNYVMQNWSKICYYPEWSKSWLVTWKTAGERAEFIFKHVNIKITTEGKRHLGAVIGTTHYQQNHMNKKID